MSFIGIVRPICSLLKPFWRPCDDDHGALRGIVMAPTGLASCATHRRQRCFGMGQPELHVHMRLYQSLTPQRLSPLKCFHSSALKRLCVYQRVATVP